MGRAANSRTRNDRRQCGERSRSRRQFARSLAMDAQAVVVNVKAGVRPREDFLMGVNQTALDPGDILTEFVLTDLCKCIHGV